jgi:hypothetical protein
MGYKAKETGVITWKPCNRHGVIIRKPCTTAAILHCRQSGGKGGGGMENREGIANSKIFQEF